MRSVPSDRAPTPRGAQAGRVLPGEALLTCTGDRGPDGPGAGHRGGLMRDSFTEAQLRCSAGTPISLVAELCTAGQAGWDVASRLLSLSLGIVHPFIFV